MKRFVQNPAAFANQAGMLEMVLNDSWGYPQTGSGALSTTLCLHVDNILNRTSNGCLDAF